MTNLVALALATIVLVMIPGPNVALIVANSLRYGLREGAVTVFGTTLGIALQLALVMLGVVAVIEFAAEALSWIRWGGVAYLLLLGIRAWREPVRSLDAVQAQPTVFWRACMIAAINPKTLLFNAAFLPQFLPTGAGTFEIMLTVAVFLSVLLSGDMLWATFATSSRRLLHRYGGIRNRLTGAFLLAAGVGLALSRRDF
jgi:threonine/homoserine/homoserine lactone efflux protein